MTHQEQLRSYNAGWSKAFWQGGFPYNYTASDFPCAEKFRQGEADGAQARKDTLAKRSD